MDYEKSPPKEAALLNNLTIELYQKTTALSRLRVQVLTVAAIASMLLFLLQVLEPLVNTISFEVYTDVKSVLITLLVGFISLSISVAIASIIIQSRVQKEDIQVQKLPKSE